MLIDLTGEEAAAGDLTDVREDLKLEDEEEEEDVQEEPWDSTIFPVFSEKRVVGAKPAAAVLGSYS